MSHAAASPTPILFLRPDAIPLLKATFKKLVTVPGYTKRDGTVVGPHQKEVHYNPDVLFADVAAGKGSHSQKKAHAKLAPKDWWQKLGPDDKAIAVMSLATDLQAANTAAADVSVWKKTALSGKNPAPAQWAAFNALPSQKKAALLDQVKAAVGVGHLKDAAPVKTAPAAQQSDEQPPVPAPAPAAVAPTPPPAPPEPPPIDVAADLDAQAQLAALENGPHWQKVALAELKNNPSWQKMPPALKLYTAIAHYQKLQSAASASAAMSVGKKAMLAGKVPSPSQYAALMAAGADKLAKVKAEVGAEKFDALMAQAAAKGATKQAANAAAPSTQAPAAAPPAVDPAPSPAPPDAGTTAPAPTGPKDGDTKEGADGVLVFKDGRWHKVVAADEHGEVPPVLVPVADPPPQPKAKPSALVKDTVEVEAQLFTNTRNGHNKQWSISVNGDTVSTQWGKIGATQQVQTKFFSSHAAAADHVIKLAISKIKSGYLPAGKTIHLYPNLDQSPDLSPTVTPSAVAAKPTATPPVEPAAPTKKKPKPAPKVTQVTAASVPGGPQGVPIMDRTHATSMDGWKQVGKQAGSNPGGKFVDPAGQAWYVKFPASENHVRNELLAAKFYEMLGVPGPKLMQVRRGEQVGIAARWINAHETTPQKLKAAPGAVENFPIDAWLANYDVVGAIYDNMLVGEDGKAVRIDTGGSLLYRAQGKPKGAAFSRDVPELDSMTDPKKNGPAAAVFAGAKKQDFLPALKKLALLKPSQIGEMVDLYGPKDSSLKAELVEKLTARRAFILERYGIDDPANKPPVNESNIPGVNPSKLPTAIDFSNINGKPLSSKAHVNDQNTKDSQALAAFAAKGNLTAVKEYQYDAVDKENGAALGKKSILQHPANLIKKQWGETVQALQSIAYPVVESLSLPPVAGAISAFFHPQDNVATIATAHGMGYFMKIGDADNIPALESGVKPFFLKPSHPLIAQAKTHYAGYSSLVKKFIGAVQASGWINHVWSQGKEGAVDSVQVPIQKLASEVYKNATEMPEGAILTRNMQDSSGETVKALLAAKPGAVFQNTDSMCTSFNSEWGAFGGDIKLKITCAKGSKALLSWGSGKFGSEKEITTLPGQRFLVTSITKGTHAKGSGVTVECIMLPPVDAYVASVDQLAALGKSFSIESNPWNHNTTTAFPHPWPNRSAPRLLVARMSYSAFCPSFLRSATPCS